MYWKLSSECSNLLTLDSFAIDEVPKILHHLTFCSVAHFIFLFEIIIRLLLLFCHLEPLTTNLLRHLNHRNTRFSLLFDFGSHLCMEMEKWWQICIRLDCLILLTRWISSFILVKFEIFTAKTYPSMFY